MSINKIFMQDSQKDHGKYAVCRIHDYLGDLRFGVVLLEKVVPML